MVLAQARPIMHKAFLGVALVETRRASCRRLGNLLHYCKQHCSDSSSVATAATISVFAMILALTAVSALFVGLVAIVLYRYKRGGVDGEEGLQQQQLQQQRAVQQWVAERDVSLPSVAAVLRAINNSRTDKHTLLPSEVVCNELVTVVFSFYMYLSLPSLTMSQQSVRELRLEQLLPGTPLPVFTPVDQMSSVDTDIMV